MLISLLLPLVYAGLSLPVGHGLAMEQQAFLTNSPCTIEVDISPARAGASCQLEILVSLDTATLDAQFAFYWSNNSVINTTSDAVSLLSGLYTQAQVNCPTAGTWYLGVVVTKCPLCSSILSAYFDLGVYYVISTNVHVDLDPNTPFLSSWITVGSNAYVYFDLNITELGSPHFTIEKAATSKGDTYDHYLGPAGLDYTSASVQSMYAVDTSFTGDELMGNRTAPGNYTFVVHVSSVLGGSSTQFRLTFNWDMDATQSYPSAKDMCPTETCSAVLNCKSCAAAECYWCESSLTCQNGPICGSSATLASTTLADFTSQAAANATLPPTSATAATTTVAGMVAAVSDSGACVDHDAFCKTLTHCGQCVPQKGCVWCNTLGAVGINTGSCSAGYQNNGQKCSDLLISPAAMAQCPASHVALAALAAVLAVLLAL